MNIVLISSGVLVTKKEATWLTLHSLAKYYLNRGHKVIICAEKKEGFPDIEIVDGVKVYRLFSGKSIFKLLNARRTMKYIKNREGMEFDIVHGFSSSPVMAIQTFLAGKGKKIHTIKSYAKTKIGRNFLIRSLNLVDIVTVPTNNMNKFLISKKCKNVEVVRSNIDLSKFKPKNKLDLKEKYGYLDKKIIFYYGAMRFGKGVDNLIKSLPKVIASASEAQVIIAMRSKSWKYDKYSKMVKEYGVDGYVDITYQSLPIEDYVAMADVLVLAYPNLYGTEANPSCMLEAMASKTLVVTTDLPDILEIAEGCVLFAKAGNVVSLSEKIIESLTRDNQNIIEKAFRISKNFSTDKVANQFLNLYSDLLEKQSIPISK
jgi:glycosyltransferase involved in cell wall biosynthesis